MSSKNFLRGYQLLQMNYTREISQMSLFAKGKISAVKIYIFRDSATDIWFFDVWCESLLKVTVQNFRLLFLTETDLKSFFEGIATNCNNELNKLSLSIIVQYFIITTKLCDNFKI